MSLRAYGNVTDRMEWNTVVYWVDQSGFLDPSTGNDLRVPAYVRFDTGFTFQLARVLELALWGQNLIDQRHPEILENSSFVTPDVVRGFYGRVTARF